MEYLFSDIEQKAREKWSKDQIYRVDNFSDKPKYYVLDMFPYPSGAGLHVGHPLGYIASDIFARYKRLKGYNVLHPMGFDAFGLPAEQYALETGQHPAVTTENNIARYKEQLNNIGFCYDWTREVRTSDPKYYKWTQWIFMQLFNSWFDKAQNKARPIDELKRIFETVGNTGIVGNSDRIFTEGEWKAYTEKEQRKILMQYRLAYLDHADVWWCEALGTVLANDEVVNGVSERGSHPVERKQMRQWFLRITEYAERLLESLNNLEWSDSMKEMQRNWIGKSTGAEIRFKVVGHNNTIEVFTTRPDTIFGVDFMVLAPEHQLVDELSTPAQKEAIEEYIRYVKSRSERERISEVKQVTGCFTGAHALHPFTGREIPVWISEYVLAGYGTGAIMAVPSGDDRDHAFANHFELPITNIFGALYNGEKAYSEKSATLSGSDFLDRLTVAEASDKAIARLEEMGIGKRRVNYKLRDAGFSRQRYWGEPFPIVYVDDVPYTTEEYEGLPEHLRRLPVELPKVDHYKPGPEGQGPLANLADWMHPETTDGTNPVRESNTMPGYAGSSWYFLRYMDPANEQEFADRKAIDYWNQVDLYVGGTEHAVGHLLYSRMWTKALFDLGHIGFDEPFRRLLNQGMIQGNSRYILKFRAHLDGAPDHGAASVYVSSEYLKNNESNILRLIFEKRKTVQTYREHFHNWSIDRVHVDVNIVDGFQLDIEKFRKWRVDNKEAEFITEDDGTFFCIGEVEKMSKSKYNVVNPDDIVAQYGADTFRMYEMFLGPVEMSKPWDTKGIEGVHRFLKKMWRLYADPTSGWIVNDDAPTAAELKVLHKAIKKITEDVEKFSFNTAVSQFMITVNELTDLGCHKRGILEPLAILICPFAPHIAEVLWTNLGKSGSIVAAAYPEFDGQYLVENSKVYPVAVNGKTRIEIEFPLDASQEHVENAVLSDATIQKWLEGKTPKKIIYVKGKMINVVI